MGESTEINFKKFVILGPVILFTEICPSGRVASSHLQQIFIFQKFLSENGRDEKGCKMGVDTLTVDQVEKSRMVDVDREKVCGVDVDRQNLKIQFLYFVNVDRCLFLGRRQAAPFHHAPENFIFPSKTLPNFVAVFVYMMLHKRGQSSDWGCSL